MSQMRQQVNLYQETAPPWRPFGSATLTLAVAAVSGCLAVIWGFGTWQVNHLQQAVIALQHQQHTQQAMLSALGSLPGAGASAADLQSRLQELDAELAVRQRALALLKRNAAGSTNGFSAALDRPGATSHAGPVAAADHALGPDRLDESCRRGHGPR